MQMKLVRLKHIQWGLGDKLYELYGGYEIYVKFDKHGKIKVLAKDCIEVNDEIVSNTVNVEIVSNTVNESIFKLKNLIKESPDGVSKKEIMNKLKWSDETVNEIIPKVIRIDGFKRTSFENSDEFQIRYIEPEPEEQLRRKKMLEAFRLGIVPGFAVLDITIGRDKEKKAINDWLKQDQGSLMVVAQYGEGKTHMIRYAKELALKSGYLVGYCDIGSESQMHKPKTIFNTLMKSLEFRNKYDDEKDLSRFIKLYANFIAKNNLKNKMNENIFLKDPTNNIIRLISINSDPTKYESFKDFIKYLEGDETIRRFQKIHNYATSANIICNLLSGIGNMASCLSESEGCKGLLTIFDEGEDVSDPRYQMQQRYFGKNFFFGLTKMTNNDPNLTTESFYKNDYGKYQGEKTKLIYSGMQRVKFTNFVHSHTKCLYAFVEGQDVIIDKLEFEGVNKITLSPFTEDEKKMLIDKISEIHQECYEYKIKNYEQLVKKILKVLRTGNNTRSIIKITTEALDLTLANPNDSYEIILKESHDRVNYNDYE